MLLAHSEVAPASREGARIPVIDVLRGLCVLFVVVHHIHINFRLRGVQVGDLLPDALARVVFWSGYYAVIIFFVISGFLITSLSLRRWGSASAIGLREFYALRAARILPCLLLLLSVLSLLHLGQVQGFVIKPERATLGRALVAALGLHVNWLEGHRGYLPGNWDVLWSLSVEEMFYLGFPLLCVGLRRELWLLLPLLLLIALGPFSRVLNAGQSPWEDYAYLSCMDGIAFGCLAAFGAARLRPGARLRAGARVVGVAAMLLVVVFRGAAASLGLIPLGLNVTLLQLGVALLLFGLNASASGQVRGASAPLRYVGRCSYEIYLFHMFAVTWGAQAFVGMHLGREWLATWYALELLASVALGAAVARGYSEPINAWLRERALALRPRGRG